MIVTSEFLYHFVMYTTPIDTEVFLCVMNVKSEPQSSSGGGEKGKGVAQKRHTHKYVLWLCGDMHDNCDTEKTGLRQ